MRDTRRIDPMRLAHGEAIYPPATCCFCSPSPSIPRRMVSPDLRNTGEGLMPSPTPGGVPVVTTSPGNRDMQYEMYDTSFATLKIIVLVFPVCMRFPFRSSHMARPCGSRISSLVTSHGPSGAKVSKLLPLSHVWPRSSCHSRSETSLQIR